MISTQIDAINAFSSIIPKFTPTYSFLTLIMSNESHNNLILMSIIMKLANVKG